MSTDLRLKGCWLWHRWGQWKDYARGTVTYHFGATSPVVLQERRCTQCNRLEQRVVKP